MKVAVAEVLREVIYFVPETSSHAAHAYAVELPNQKQSASFYIAEWQCNLTLSSSTDGRTNSGRL